MKKANIYEDIRDLPEMISKSIGYCFDTLAEDIYNLTSYNCCIDYRQKEVEVLIIPLKNNLNNSITMYSIVLDNFLNFYGKYYRYIYSEPDISDFNVFSTENIYSNSQCFHLINSPSISIDDSFSNNITSIKNIINIYLKLNYDLLPICNFLNKFFKNYNKYIENIGKYLPVDFKMSNREKSIYHICETEEHIKFFQSLYEICKLFDDKFNLNLSIKPFNLYKEIYNDSNLPNLDLFNTDSLSKIKIPDLSNIITYLSLKN